MEQLEQQVSENTPIEIAWRSYELRPRNAPPPAPEYLAKVQAGRPRIYAIAKQQYGLEMDAGPFGIDSRPLLIGAKYAESVGHGPAYHARLMRAYWQEAQAVDDRAVLVNLAEEIGLDREGFQAALDDNQWLQAVLKDLMQAYEYGIGGVPAMVFDNRFLVSGAQPLETLLEAVERVAQGDSV